MAGIAERPSGVVVGNMIQALLSRQNITLDVFEVSFLQAARRTGKLIRADMRKGVIANFVACLGDGSPWTKLFFPTRSEGDEVEGASETLFVEQGDGEPQL